VLFFLAASTRSFNILNRFLSYIYWLHLVPGRGIKRRKRKEGKEKMKFRHVAGVVALVTAALAAPSSNCRCFPGDGCWPSDYEWSALNATVNGRLIKTVPLGSPCHGDAYDAALCASLQEKWQFEEIQYVVIFTFFLTLHVLFFHMLCLIPPTQSSESTNLLP
jgi:hypothetical protein